MASARTCSDLLWNPERLFSTGDHTPSLSSPEHCQPLISCRGSSALWSLLLMKSDQIQPDFPTACGLSLSSPRISDLTTAHMITFLAPLGQQLLMLHQQGHSSHTPGTFWPC